MKDDIRRFLKAKRRDFAGKEREIADGLVFENFLSAYLKYDSFFIYNSFGSEADTGRIINYLAKIGKRVYLPKVEGENIAPAPLGKTVLGKYGIEEPVGQAYFGDIDVTVIPLLAVNERGYRIGYGGGYYDRYLAGRHTLKVGLCYCFQFENFCEDGWDIRLDELLTDRGIYRFNED